MEKVQKPSNSVILNEFKAGGLYSNLCFNRLREVDSVRYIFMKRGGGMFVMNDRPDFDVLLSSRTNGSL
jgi:hypothetical protein